MMQFWGDLAQDIRYAWRMMAANPLFTVMATLSLALGIGANTAIYSFMDAILMRSLPVGDPASLIVMSWHAKPITPGRASSESTMHSMDGSTFSFPGGMEARIFPYP